MLLLAMLFCYSNAMRSAFVFDDRTAVMLNDSIRSVLPLSQSLWGPRDTPVAGRPLVNLSFALNYACGGLNPFGYHLTSILLHWINTAMLFTLVHRTLNKSSWDDPWPDIAWQFSFAVASLWALHPLQTETVSYVTQRSELFVAFFLLATVYCSRRAWDAANDNLRRTWTAIAIFCCALGMGCKEVMVVTPVLVVLYDLSMLKEPLARLIQRRWPLYAGLLSTWVILALLLSANPRGKSIELGTYDSVVAYLKTQSWAVTQYLKLSVWPAGMCGDYGELRITDWKIWFPCMLTLALIASGTLFAWFRWRPLSFLGVWFFLILAPTSSIIPIITEPIAERRMYLPLAAVVVLFVACFVKILGRWLDRPSASKVRWKLSQTGMFAGYAFLAVTYCVVTFYRNEVFQRELTFWKDVTEKCPQNIRGFLNLGNSYLFEKQPELALINFLRAVQREPYYVDAHRNLKTLYSLHGLVDEATLHNQSVISPNANVADGYFKLGNRYGTQGKSEHAVIYYDLAIALGCQHPQLHLNRGLMLLRENRFEAATISFRRSIELNPNLPDAYVSLGDVFFTQERYDESIAAYRDVVERFPQEISAYANLAAALTRKKNYDESIQWSERALKLNPNLPDAYYNLGDCYAFLNRHDESIAAYKNCLSMNPNDFDAWMRLGNLYLSSNQIAGARDCFEQAIQLRPGSPDVLSLIQRLDAN